MTAHSPAAVPTVHRIVIHPIDRLGNYRTTDRETGQQWVAKTRSTACTTARVLMNCGAAPEDRLEVYREGRERPHMIGTIGWFADHMTSEAATHGPHFVKFRPFDRAKFAA